MTLPRHIFRQILDDPTANDGIIGHNQNRDDGVDPTAEAQRGPVPERFVSADRAFFGHAADRGFGNDHRVAEGHGQDDVDQQKNAAAVFGGEIGEAPDVSKTYGRTGGGKNKADFSGKGTSLEITVFHESLLALLHE